MIAQIPVRVGGVPEHFNLPWRLAIEDGSFADAGYDIEWIDYPGGTGAIMAALGEGHIDIATPLTEGAVTAIENGNPSELVTGWVDSPLDWGVFAAGHSPANTVAELEGKRFAISRYGSGSELMSLVMAKDYGWSIDDDSFVVVGGLTGAVEALPSGDAEIFMWDKAMTQPHVESGALKLVGSYATPWPSFTVAQTTAFQNAHPGVAIDVTRIAATTASALEERNDAAELITQRYGLVLPEVTQWLAKADWTAPGTDLDVDMIADVRDTMVRLGRITA